MVRTMNEVATAAGFSAVDTGVYLQPIVQGSNFQCEFNLFYNPGDPGEVKRVREASIAAVKKLLGKGAFFSRPHGETARLVMNRDAATVQTLKRVKSIVDPDNIMNPGKLCF